MLNSQAIRLAVPSAPRSAPPHGGGNIHSPSCLTTTFREGQYGTQQLGAKHQRRSMFIPKAVADQPFNVVAFVQVLPTIRGLLNSINGVIDDPAEVPTEESGRSLLLELVSSELDCNGEEKPTVVAYARHIPRSLAFEASFEVPAGFGPIGAVYVENKHNKEIRLRTLTLSGPPPFTVHLSCQSWVQPHARRIFFTSTSYLPSETPPGIRRLRQEELYTLRGDGTGERERGERIYDYDVYNDLGEPDATPPLRRPVLGGAENPYPRRCRTGRPMTESDPLSETRSGYVYVPRDEEFSELKTLHNNVKQFAGVLRAVGPTLRGTILGPDNGFFDFDEINALYKVDRRITSADDAEAANEGLLPNLLGLLISRRLLRFYPPPPFDKDKFFWLRDDEFGRETVAGLNPCVIKLVQQWPLRSSLDAAEYGPPESAITDELVERRLGGINVYEAMRQKKLFVIDYHDILLPLVPLIRQQEGTTLYGSRALFFLNSDGMLEPVAIELARPPMDGEPQWKQAFSPGTNATDVMLWRLAKVHFLAHDSGYHQLISHWLRTHAVTEPYIIAANRQMSEMHPIYRLLNPHFRYTLEINGQAREGLINSGGIIESSFSPLGNSIQLSSIIYDKLWRFDHESLPNDLISRGMAEPDASAPHGLKLTIEDYPYANDGLILWDAITEWVTSYVTRFYPEDALIRADTELQAWWNEVRTVGHADKKDEPWWPTLDTSDDLIGVLSTIIWVASGHHAAVNFGQYFFAGYFPNRPSIARRNIPSEYSEESAEYQAFLESPERWMLDTLPTRIQAATVTLVLDSLSLHSVDEEYIGEKMELAWEVDPEIRMAFLQFQSRVKALEKEIDERNKNPDLKNRNGAGILPYEYLKPFSPPGRTDKGVPNSISI